MLKIRLLRLDRIDKKKGFKCGDVFEFDHWRSETIVIEKNGNGFDKSQVEIFTCLANRDFLRDFVKMNNIKTTLVSKALGKSQNWLTQMMNDKRRDMTDATLKSIMKQLHIDWASNEFLHVRSEVAYRTRPSNYTTTQHKERLQRDFWNGMVTKA